MRIRKSAARLLGSAYSAPATPAPGAPSPTELLVTPPPPPPPPPAHLAACSAPLESCGLGGYSTSATASGSGETCELSRSPWDLIAELSLSDPQVEDDLVDKYFVHVTTRASWLFSASMPVSSSKKVAAAARERAKRRRDAARRLSKKAAASKVKAEASSKANVKKEEVKEVTVTVPVRVWKCKKNDGKRWHCHRTVSQPNTLCSYHFVQKRSYLNPDFEPSAVELEEEVPTVPVPSAPSKPSSNNKPRKRRPTSDFNATEGFYYYAGFGPFRSKRHSRSQHGTNEPVPAKQEEAEEEVPEPEDASPPAADQARSAEDDTENRAAAKDEVSSSDDDIAGIAGVDEESSDDDYDGIGIAGSSMDPKANNGDGKRKTPWKRWRKPVKARSLMSLM